MFRKLSARLWLTYALLIGIVLCVVSVGLLAYIIRIPTPARQLFNQLQLIATFLQKAERLAESPSFEQMQQAASRTDENFGVRVLILDQNRLVIIDSQKNEAAPLPERFDRPRILANNTIPTQFVDVNRRTWLYVKKELENGFILVVAAPRPKVTLRTLLRDEIFNPFLQAGLLALLVSLIFATSISRWIAQPLERISNTAKKGIKEPFDLKDTNSPIEIQELTEALNEMNSKVVSSQQSQRDFVANVSHDLKTPLTSIQGFAQAILDGTVKLPDQVHDAAQIIYNETERMNRMVVDLLELARLESGLAEMKHESVDLLAIIKDQISHLSPQLQAKEIELIQELSLLKPIIGDGDRLARVFSNILDNAVKFSPSKSQIRIRASMKDNEIIISIQDNGPGIPPQDIGYIFDRFYQVDKTRSSAQRGTGLGLAICKEIVHAHGGSISVYNNNTTSNRLNNQPGCTFEIKLPAARL